MRRGRDSVRRAVSFVLLLAAVLATAGCACRPGVIGPYGGRPPRCYVL